MKKLLLIFLIAVTITPQAQTYRRMAYLSRSVGQHIYYLHPPTVAKELHDYNVAHGYTGSDSCSITNIYKYPDEPIANTLYYWRQCFDTVGTGTLYTRFIDNAAYDIIMVKECFASQSDIWSVGGPADTLGDQKDQSIYLYKWHCRDILHKMAANSDKFFVWWTIPPLIGGNIDDALRLYQFNKWMKDTLATGLDATYGTFPDNVFIFDVFSLVEDANHQLPLSLADGSGDSHPNAAYAAIVAPEFVEQALNAAINFETPAEAPKTKWIPMDR